MDGTSFNSKHFLNNNLGLLLHLFRSFDCPRIMMSYDKFISFVQGYSLTHMGSTMKI